MPIRTLFAKNCTLVIVLPTTVGVAVAVIDRFPSTTFGSGLRAVMLADGAASGLDQGLGEFGADEVPAVVAQLGDTARGGAGEGVGGGVFGEQAGGEHGVEAADVTGELGKAEIDQAVQLADAVVKILAQAVGEPRWSVPEFEAVIEDDQEFHVRKILTTEDTE